MTAKNGVVTVTAVGLPPDLDPAALRVMLDDAGLSDSDLRIQLVGGNTRLCAVGSTACSIVAGG